MWVLLPPTLYSQAGAVKLLMSSLVVLAKGLCQWQAGAVKLWKVLQSWYLYLEASFTFKLERHVVGGATLVALAKGLYWWQAGVTGLWTMSILVSLLRGFVILQAGASRPRTLAALAKGLLVSSWSYRDLECCTRQAGASS